jgi:serine/threonine protein kinase
VVYEMLTGRVPFPLEGGGASVVIMRMLTEPANPPTLLAPGLLPFTTDAVVLRAIESDPRRRYATASEFSRDLAQIVPVAGGDSPFAYTLRRAATTLPLRTSAMYAPPRSRPYVVASPRKPSRSPRWWLCSLLHRRRHD